MGVALGLSLSFFGCSKRFRAGKCSSCSGYFGVYIDRQVSLMLRLLRVQLFWGLHRRGHGQAGVAYVPTASRSTSTRAWTGRRRLCSGCTSTRAWTGRRRLCSGCCGGYIDEGMDRLASLMFRLLRWLHRRGRGQAGVAYVPATSGATSTRAFTGSRRLCSGYFGGYIDEGMDRLASLMFRLLRELHRRGRGQAGVSYDPSTSRATSTRAMGRQVSLMFRLLRVRNRRGHGQAGVPYVQATSGQHREWHGDVSP